MKAFFSLSSLLPLPKKRKKGPTKRGGVGRKKKKKDKLLVLGEKKDRKLDRLMNVYINA